MIVYKISSKKFRKKNYKTTTGYFTLLLENDSEHIVFLCNQQSVALMKLDYK